MGKKLILLIILLCSAVSVEAQVTSVIKQKGNNVGPSGLSNIGVLPCVATAVAPTYIEGFQVGCSTDLAGSVRTSAAGGGAGGTSSTFGVAFPATGTAAGWFDGTNMQGARVFDLDTGVGIQYVAGSTLRCSAAGGSTECLPAIAIDADGIANQTSTYIHGMGYMYNGVTWDRMRGAIATGLLVNVSNASLAVTGTFFQVTQPVSIAATVSVQGVKSNNAVVPGATNTGTLPCVATTAAPIYTDTFQVGCSTTLAGATRSEVEVSGTPASVTNPLAIRDGNGTSFFSSDTIGTNIYKKVSLVQDIEVSTVNSSVVNLASAASFTGTSQTTLGVGSIQITLFSDQNCTIQIQQAQEDPGINWNVIDSWTYTANSKGVDAARTVQAVSSSIRVVVTNNGSAITTIFNLQTIVCPICDTLPRGLTQAGNLKAAIVENTGSVALESGGNLAALVNRPIAPILPSGLNPLTFRSQTAVYCRSALCPPPIGGFTR